MHWRGSVLTREPILDAPTVVARESDVQLGAATILARVAAASYIGTLAAWSAGILVLVAVLMAFNLAAVLLRNRYTRPR